MLNSAHSFYEGVSLKRLLSTLVFVSVVASVQAAPPPGHPSVDQAQRMINVPTDQSMPFKGRVLQVIESNDYSYIEVTVEKDTTRWLAAPRITLPVNSWVRYGDGAEMKDFYSRKHKRTFAEVWFVDQVSPLAE